MGEKYKCRYFADVMYMWPLSSAAYLLRLHFGHDSTMHASFARSLARWYRCSKSGATRARHERAASDAKTRGRRRRTATRPTTSMSPSCAASFTITRVVRCGSRMSPPSPSLPQMRDLIDRCAPHSPSPTLSRFPKKDDATPAE